MTDLTTSGLTAADRIEIHELVTSYGVHHDARDFARLRECFTEDARYVMRIADGTVHGPRLGADAIVDQIVAFKEAQNDKRRHHISNVQVTPLSADEASALSYLIVSVIDDAGLEFITVGTYTDTVVRTGRGWRIAAKELFLDRGF